MARRNGATPLEGAYGKCYEGPEVCAACVNYEAAVCKLNPPVQPTVGVNDVCSHFEPSQKAIEVFDAEWQESLKGNLEAVKQKTITRLTGFGDDEATDPV